MADSAHTTDLSRRTILARSPVAALATAAAFSALPILSAGPVNAAATDAQFLAWEKEWHALEAAINRAGDDEDEVDRLASEETDFERLIFETPSASRSAAEIKARFLLHYARNSLMDDLVSPLEHILSALSGIGGHANV